MIFIYFNKFLEKKYLIIGNILLKLELFKRNTRKIKKTTFGDYMPFVRNLFVRTALVRIAICYNFHSLEIPFVGKNC